jgi:hypothetical protein
MTEQPEKELPSSKAPEATEPPKEVYGLATWTIILPADPGLGSWTATRRSYPGHPRCAPFPSDGKNSPT